MNRKNPFADPDALVDYGLRGRDIVIVNTPIPPRVPSRTPPKTESVSVGAGVYILMDQTSRYALGVHALRDACVAERNLVHPQYTRGAGSGIYRPFTFKEGIKARVDDYNILKNPNGSDRTLDERLKLFTAWNDSCTGIAYEAGTTKFKIVPVCEPLILIDRDDNSNFLAIPYASLVGAELDSKPGLLNIRTKKCKYAQHLTKQEIEEHDAWRGAVEGDVALLKEYRDIVFAALQERNASKQMPEKAMGFHVQQNPDTDELRALLVDDLDYYSLAFGNGDLGNGGSFVRLAPSQIFSP